MAGVMKGGFYLDFKVFHFPGVVINLGIRGGKTGLGEEYPGRFYNFQSLLGIMKVEKKLGCLDRRRGGFFPQSPRQLDEFSARFTVFFP